MANISLATASLGFYAYWKYEPLPGSGEAHRIWGYLALLCGSTAGNYLAGYLLQKRPRAWLLGVSIAINLCILGYFKYAEFFITNMNATLGIDAYVAAIALPLGAS